MVSKVFVCTGSCGGVVSENDFKKGKSTCGADHCERFGKPLVPRILCPECGDTYQEGTKHECEDVS